MGKPISLEVHHIDGNGKNNSLDNLQLLCPNCHSQTENYKGKNVKKKKIDNKIITDEELIKALNQCDTIHQALRSVGLTEKGGNYARIYNLCLKNSNLAEKFLK